MSNSLLKRFLTPGLRKWAYDRSGFNQYGLWRDDLITERYPEVQEALRRLPQHIRDERNFRIVRAVQLDIQKRVLPKEQWTKLEEDKLYLTPYIEEVLKEMEEKERWEHE